MADREKLIEILREVQYYGVVPWKHGTKAVGIDEVADYLIANGVTFGKDINVPDKNVGDKLTPTADHLSATATGWIPVTERLPKVDTRVLVYLREEIYGTARMDTDRVKDDGRWVRWHGCVSHWMQLPEPPKEVE